MSTGHVTRVRKLYKLILRLHRNLPDDLRVLGDLYAKEEFRRHKNCKPDEARTFLYEWQDYTAIMLRQASPARAPRAGAVQVGADDGKPRFGNDLPPEVIHYLAPDKLYNLYKLLAHARGGDAHEPIDAGIGLTEGDGYTIMVSDAKKYITELDKIEKEKIARGEIKEDEVTFAADAWLQLFDIAVEGRDKTGAMKDLAQESAENEEEAKKANENAKLEK